MQGFIGRASGVAYSVESSLVDDAAGYILPGVGAAPSARRALEKNGWWSWLEETRAPVLGICLGLQLMSRSSDEGNVDGLGHFETATRAFQKAPFVPHMGWNSVKSRGSRLLEGVPYETDFYFVHGYRLDDFPESTGVSSYFDDFAVVAEKDLFYGVQFHPEKSGEAGARVIQNYVDLCFG